jgi:hypothetical protein
MNACWMLGCAIALAAISYASWEASTKEEKFLYCVKQSHVQIVLNFSGLLFCLGMVGTSNSIWQQILWIALAIGFLAQIINEFYQRKNIQKSTK